MSKEEEGNPFLMMSDLLFIDSPIIAPRIKRPEAKAVREYAYAHRLYRHALKIIENLTEKQEKSVGKECLRKAFCYAMLKDTTSAVETFRLCEENGVEISEELQAVYASCLMSIGQPTEAIRVYKQLFGHEGTTISLYSYAVALSQTNQYAEACDILYQEDYLRPNQTKVVRLLAWCSLKANISDTLQLYHRLLTMQPLRSIDWLNAGHAALAAGAKSEAMNYYRQSELQTFTADDRTLLASLGVPQQTISLVEDALQI